ALAATACVSGPGAAAAATPAPAPAPELPKLPPLPKLEFDDAWTRKLTGTYRAVFDSPEIDDGTAVFNAYSYMKGFEDMYKIGDAEVNAVIVARHRAIPMILDDGLWAGYELGEYAKVKDPTTGKWALRNPFWAPDPKDKSSADYALETLVKRGVIVLGCALATRGFAGILASRTKNKPDAMFDELRRHLIPTAILQPSGIFAVMRAQASGCHYMRST
ncbi:MAG: hypothetical protein KGL38_12155, partial [Gemmatimonadota bacterium]|nr:hypothetical protein [Gemmatimonadota bacterium]